MTITLVRTVLLLLMIAVCGSRLIVTGQDFQIYFVFEIMMLPLIFLKKDEGWAGVFIGLSVVVLAVLRMFVNAGSQILWDGSELVLSLLLIIFSLIAVRKSRTVK